MLTYPKFLNRFRLVSGVVVLVTIGSFLAQAQDTAITLYISGDCSGLVTSSPSGINCPGTCSAAFPDGSTVTLSAIYTSNNCFNEDGWTAGLDYYGEGSTLTVTVPIETGDCGSYCNEVTIGFGNGYPLTVLENGNGNGTVTSSPSGINCGANCTYAFNSDDQGSISLNDIPDSGSAFTGWEGAGCSGLGGCTLDVDSTQTVTATFSAVAPIITGRNAPFSIAVDNTYIYWAENGSTVMKILLDGFSPSVVAFGQDNPANIAIDSANVYWTDLNDSGTISMTPKFPPNPSNAVPIILASDQDLPFGIAVDTINVYWTDYGNGTVMKVPIGGGTVSTLASGQNQPAGIAVSTSTGNIYWADTGSNTIMYMPINGSSATILASNQGEPIYVAVDTTSVYWTTASGGTVMEAPLNGGFAETLALDQSIPLAVTVDASNVYWTNYGDGTVGSVSKNGFYDGPVNVLSVGQNDPYSITADANNIYWVNFGNGTLMEIPKGNYPMITLNHFYLTPPSIFTRIKQLK